MLNPLISIIVPCYNQAQYLDECLQSVFEQTYENWECIIVNDGSPDHTEEVSKRWVEKDARFKYFKTENGGVSAARNYGIDKAVGEWILPLDGDDRIAVDYLLNASKEFHNEPQIIYAEAEYFGAKSGKMILPEFNPSEMLIENQIFCSAFFRKEDWKIVGGFDEQLLAAYEDWEFWISFVKNFPDIKVIKLQMTGLYYRIKENSRNVVDTENTLKVKDYIYRKHSELVIRNFEQLKVYFYENKRLHREVSFLRKLVDSKRFIYLNKILSFFNR